MNEHPLNTRSIRFRVCRTCFSVLPLAASALAKSSRCSSSGLFTATRSLFTRPIFASFSRRLGGRLVTHDWSAGSTWPPVALAYEASFCRFLPSSILAAFELKAATLRGVPL